MVLWCKYFENCLAFGVVMNMSVWHLFNGLFLPPACIFERTDPLSPRSLAASAVDQLPPGTEFHTSGPAGTKSKIIKDAEADVWNSQPGTA